MSEQLMKVADVAEYLQVCKKTVYNWIKAGKIQALRLPNGKIRFKPKQIKALLAKGSE